MCGIAGIINKNGAPVDRGLLERMTERARHRGPDGSGYYLSTNLGFGHRRLAIIAAKESCQCWNPDIGPSRLWRLTAILV